MGNLALSDDAKAVAIDKLRSASVPKLVIAASPHSRAWSPSHNTTDADTAVI